MRKTLLFTVAASLTLFGAAAQADPTYRAADILSHFAPATDLGPSRALCIGTDSECAKATAPKPVSNFNLRVTFEYNSATLTKAARENLDEFAKALKNPQLGRSAFVVEGYTDAKGSDGYNLDLSGRRAQAVVSYLQGQGADAAKLEAKGFGKERPIAGDPMNPSNRRVETRLRTE